MTERLPVLISTAVVVMNLTEWLKNITFLCILSRLMFFCKRSKITVELPGCYLIGQNDKCVSTSVCAHPVFQVIFDVGVDKGRIGNHYFQGKIGIGRHVLQNTADYKR